MGLNGYNLIFIREPHDQGRSTLTLFDSWLVPSKDRRATDITLDELDLVLPGAAKITLIVPRGGLKGVSLSDRELVCPPRPLEWCSICFNFALSDKLVQVIPQAPTILCGMAMIPMILTIEVTISLFGISHHLIGPFEEGFVLDFF